MSLLRSLGKLLTRDLTGKTWERSQRHSYFHKLLYFGSTDPTKCYWEAELPLPRSSTDFVGVTMIGTASGPTPQEEQFCRTALSDLDALFERCGQSFSQELRNWFQEPIPADWRAGFKLDGFQVPVGGDPQNPWELCYFVEPVGHYFTAVFVNGEIHHVAVDG